MLYKIRFAPQAARDLQGLSAYVRVAVQGAIEARLRHEPTKTSKSKVKRLRRIAKPQFRLRVGDVRVF
ncbi:MAG: hypothetical protein EXR49_00170 [Dehalococcoidia bacterium]|nr:hypothetical protein [Dehalococcoidia bacterium]